MHSFVCQHRDLAPILLILCRVAQGLGLGGEWGGAVLMSFESAPAHKRAFYASLPQVGLSLGLLLASGVIGFFSAVLSNEAFINWGWRIAFIMSAGLLFVGSYIRSSVHETKDFAEAKAKMPGSEVPPARRLQALSQDDGGLYGRPPHRRRGLQHLRGILFVLPDPDPRA